MPGSTSLFRPVDGWVGDVLPIWVDGVFHLFYCFLSNTELGTPQLLKGVDLAHITTRDFVHFEAQPLALKHGGPDDADLLIGAGSILYHSNGYVMFYCGINPRRSRTGAAEQVILRATSKDLITWHKDPEFVLEADPKLYERNDWRDPAVYWDRDRWRMLLCARIPEGPFDRRGVIGSAESNDLAHWEPTDPLIVSGTTYAPECPQVIDFGGVRYLLYSTYSDRFATRYRVFNPASDVWTRPPHDELDSHDVYAMKAVSDGNRHLYLVGWLATRAGDRDSGHRQWGGDMIVHEVVQRVDNTLGMRLPTSVAAQFEYRVATFEPREGHWQLTEHEARYNAKGVGWCAVGAVHDRSIFDVTVNLTSTAEDFGLVVRASKDLRCAYFIRFEPANQRVVFDRRPHRIHNPFDYQSDRAYVSATDHEIERPLPIGSREVTCRVMVDGSALVVYVGDVALTTRGYDLDGGEFGIYAANGEAHFSDPSLGQPLLFTS